MSTVIHFWTQRLELWHTYLPNLSYRYDSNVIRGGYRIRTCEHRLPVVPIRHLSSKIILYTLYLCVYQFRQPTKMCDFLDSHHRLCASYGKLA